MACAENEKCFTITWKIEHFSRYSPSLFQSDNRHRLKSTVWKTETTDDGNAWWKLVAFYSGLKLNFALTLLGENPLEHHRCEMCLLTSYGEASMTYYESSEYVSCYYIDYKSLEKILGQTTDSIISQDTLTFCCRIRHPTMKPGQCLLLTILQRVNFLWDIDIKYFDIGMVKRIVNQQDNVILIIRLSGYFTDLSPYISVRVDLQSNIGGFATFVDCKISITDNQGRVIPRENYVFPCVSLTWHMNISKSRNLPLKLESLVAVHIENPQVRVPSDAVPGSSKTLSDDLLLLYREKTLSDATLNTKGKSFSAHRSILAARSSIFRAMFEKEETTEGRSGVVDIDDLDSETVDRMLVFLYSDSFEDMQWEEASSLYYAAEKYAVLPLRQNCVDILKAGLAVDNACDALVLADMYADNELMEFAVDFLRGHEDVISSFEWLKLENCNPRLTSEVLRKVILKKKVINKS